MPSKRKRSASRERKEPTSFTSLLKAVYLKEKAYGADTTSTGTPLCFQRPGACMDNYDEHCSSSTFSKCHLKVKTLEGIAKGIHEDAQALRPLTENVRLRAIPVRDIIHDIVRARVYPFSEISALAIESLILPASKIDQASLLAFLYILVRNHAKFKTSFPLEKVRMVLLEKVPAYVKIAQLDELVEHPEESSFPISATKKRMASPASSAGVPINDDQTTLDKIAQLKQDRDSFIHPNEMMETLVNQLSPETRVLFEDGRISGVYTGSEGAVLAIIKSLKTARDMDIFFKKLSPNGAALRYLDVLLYRK